MARVTTFLQAPVTAPPAKMKRETVCQAIKRRRSADCLALLESGSMVEEEEDGGVPDVRRSKRNKGGQSAPRATSERKGKATGKFKRKRRSPSLSMVEAEVRNSDDEAAAETFSIASSPPTTPGSSLSLDLDDEEYE